MFGQHRDAVIAICRLHELARRGKSRSAALVAGRLIEQQERRKREIRSNDLRPAWRRLEKRGERAWVKKS